MGTLGSRVLAGAVVVVLSAQGAAAQDESIVVTGSRMARPGDQSLVPVIAIDGDALARSGLDTLADGLRRDPAMATGFGPGNSNLRVSGNAVNMIDLRGLGTSRTLVLVNGRRMVAGQGGQAAPDLNMIPADLIRRVEIVTGGASAVYGSNAVAGVVNILLDDRPQGLRLDAQSGVSDRGDAARSRIGATAGRDFADGRGHVWLSGSYAHDGGLRSADRPQSAVDPTGLSPFASQGAFSLSNSIYGITGVGSGGLVFGNDYTYRNGALVKGVTQAVDGYNRDAARASIVPLDRAILMGGASYDLSDKVALDLTIHYGETRSRTALEPYAAAGGDPARDGVAAIDVPGGIALDNPYVPAPIAADIAARNSDTSAANDVRFIAFRRRLNDIFDRSNRNVRRLWRVTAGAKGDLGGGWRWDVGYVFGQTRDHSAADTILRSNFIAAVDAVQVGGAIICRDPVARAAGCQPLNLFGPGSASPAAVAWLRAGNPQTVLDSSIRQHVVTATISGAPFRLPGGMASLVAGAEYRHESSVDDWDANTNAGLVLAARADDTRGSYSVSSAFAELALPVLAHVRLEGAGRIDRYSTAGTVFNWRAAAGWSPVSALRLRLGYAEATRAPNILELYATQRLGFPGTATLDPCNGVTATRANPLDAACRAIPGIASAIAGSGSFAYATPEVQAIVGLSGGNPQLRAETARTLTAGISLEPLAGLSLSLDYYRIRIANAIGTQPRSETVAACLADPASAHCGGQVQRLANGKLTEVDAILTNTGGVREAGLDGSATLRHALGRGGVVEVGGRWTHLLEHKRQPYAGAAWIDELGQLQDADHARLGSGFHDRFTVDAAYARGPVRLGWNVRYLGPILDTRDPATAPAAGINRVAAVWYHDISLRVALPGGEGRAFRLGVLNLFDRAPPYLPGGIAASGQQGVETAQDYDVIGRYLYAGLTARF